MPRYLIERTFPAGWAGGGIDCRAIADRNTADGVTWLHSYVTPDRTRTFCIYDAPSPEAIRHAARANDLPVDRITEVRVLDPHGLPLHSHD